MLTIYVAIDALLEILHFFCVLFQAVFFIISFGTDNTQCAAPPANHSASWAQWFLLAGVVLIASSAIQRSRHKYISTADASLAPSGWKPRFLNHPKAKRRQIFVAPNTTWPTTPSFAYLATRRKDDSVKSIEDVVSETLATANSLGYEVECSHLKDFILNKIVCGSIYRITNRKYGQIDMVAYFERKHEVVFTVLCIRSNENVEAFSNAALKWFQFCFTRLVTIPKA